jgi:hypothetical protein
MSPRLRALIDRLRARAGVRGAAAGAVALAVAAAGATIAAPAASAATTSTPALAAPVAAPAALVSSPRSGVSSSGTIWLGMQAVSVSLHVPSAYSGRPHACITNNGPHAVKVVVLKVNGMSDRGRLLKAGASQCLDRGWVSVNGRTVTARFGVVDQANGVPGAKTLKVGGGYERVLHTGNVAAVQAAAGGLVVDGDLGPLTRARVDHVLSHGPSSRIARVQGALGVAADGVAGPVTREAWTQLVNSSFGRY